MNRRNCGAVHDEPPAPVTPRVDEVQFALEARAADGIAHRLENKGAQLLHLGLEAADSRPCAGQRGAAR